MTMQKGHQRGGVVVCRVRQPEAVGECMLSVLGVRGAYAST